MENSQSSILETSKDFEVTKAELYKAWTEQEQLKVWWKPEGLQLETVENELQPQGKVSYHFKTPEGETVHVTGQYQEVKPEEQLVYTWNWEIPEAEKKDGNFTLSISFQDKEGGSTLKVKQEPFSSEASAQIHKQAWEEALNNLQQHVSSRSADGHEVGNGKNSQPAEAEQAGHTQVGGYS